MSSADHESTSAAIVRGAQDGESGAWRSLSQDYMPLIVARCRAAGIAATDCADIRQDVLLKLVTQLPKFRRRGTGSFRAWLDLVVRSAIQQHFRRQRKSAPTQSCEDLSRLAAEASHDSKSAGTSAHSDLLAAMLQCQTELAERTWQAFWLTAVCEAEVDDVAQQLGLTALAVRKYKSRVLSRLRQILSR